MAPSTKDPFLLALGERVRLLRARRGLTRKSVAKASGVSERHLANLEYGVGNASILVLQQVAGALDCDLAELVGDVSTSSPEWLMLRESLRGKSDADLVEVMEADLGQFMGRAGRKTIRDEERLEKELIRIVRQTAQAEIGKKPEVTVVVSRLA